MSVDSEPRILVGVTGASGIAYARRLLDVLGDRADVILTKDAEAVIEVEAGVSVKEFVAGSRPVHRGGDPAASAPGAGVAFPLRGAAGGPHATRGGEEAGSPQAPAPPHGLPPVVVPLHG